MRLICLVAILNVGSAVLGSVAAAPVSSSGSCDGVVVDNTGTITTSGKKSPRVRITTWKKSAEYTNEGRIAVHDDNCPGIAAKAKGRAKIENRGSISTTGDNSPGISVEIK